MPEKFDLTIFMKWVKKYKENKKKLFIKPFISSLFVLLIAALLPSHVFAKNDKTVPLVYTIKHDETVEIDGMSIKNVFVQTAESLDHHTLFTSVTLFIKTPKSEGKEFVAKIISSSKESKVKSSNESIVAFDHEIVIVEADGFMGQDIKFTIRRK